MILSIRTEKPEAEVCILNQGAVIAQKTWHAHRTLSATINIVIDQLLQEHGKKRSDISGILCYLGPGSFTGLRIGVSVANALSYALQVPAAGASGDTWMHDALEKLSDGTVAQLVPEYGAPVFTTKPRK